MTYQDQKVRAIGRLAALTSVLTILLALSLAMPDRTREIVEHLPILRNGHEYLVWLGVLALTCPLLWAINLALVLTSPEQEVRFAAWSSRRLKGRPHQVDPALLDPSDPHFQTATWRYLLNRHGQ